MCPGRMVLNICLATIVMLTGHAASAQQSSSANFPTKNVEIVLPYAAGGSTDILGRVIAEALGKRLSQPVIVVNRPGATGLIGSNYVKNSNSDGHTILFHAVSAAMNQAVKPDTGFDLRRDLLPITEAVEGIAGVFVRASLPVNNLAELIQYARTNSKKLVYGSSGHGGLGHVATEAFRVAAGIGEMVHAPGARGITDSVISMTQGDLDLLVTDLVGGLPYVQSGQIKLLAVTSAERTPDAPEAMTIAEVAQNEQIDGLIGFKVAVWYGFFVSPRTPAAIAERLNAELVQALKDAAPKLLTLGYRPHQIIGSSPSEFKKFIEDDVARWEKVVADAKIRAND